MGDAIIMDIIISLTGDMIYGCFSHWQLLQTADSEFSES